MLKRELWKASLIAEQNNEGMVWSTHQILL